MNDRLFAWDASNGHQLVLQKSGDLKRLFGLTNKGDLVGSVFGFTGKVNSFKSLQVWPRQPIKATSSK